jgi:hypothetical protein
MGKCDKIEEMMKKKADALIEFVNINNKVPKTSDVVQMVGYSNFKIGEFWNNIKKGQSADLYKDVLSKNEILFTNYEKRKKDREKRMGFKVMSVEEKGNFIFAFKNVPKRSDIVKMVGYLDFKIGVFWHDIKQGNHPNLYRDVLSKNPILYADYEKTKKDREERMSIKVMSLEDKGKHLFALAKVPKQTQVVKMIGYGDFKVGHFWNNIKQGRNTDLYRDVLSKNPILYADYEKTKKDREERMNTKDGSKQIYDILDYSKMKVDELKQLCKDRGITRYSKKKKEELVSMLSNQHKPSDK